MRINHFEVERDGLILRGIMTKPDGNGPFPAVIFNHGFTGHKAEAHFLFKKLSESLAGVDIVSLRFDYIGSGESDGYFKDMTMSSEVEDCLEVFNFAERAPFIDSTQMSLLGFSMGGAISIIASSILREKVKKLVLLCPAANMFDVLTRPVKIELLTNFLEEKTIDFSGNVVSKALIDDVFQFNIYEHAKHVTAKVKLIHGTNDDAVPPLVSWKLAELFPHPDSIQWIHGSDHCFSSSSYENQVLTTVKDFMNHS